MHPTHRRQSLLAPLLGFLVLLVGSNTAAAQLELPEKPEKQKEGTEKPDERRPERERKPQRGNIAPHLTCTVCYERNYTTAIDYAAENGLQKAWCAVCRQARLHEVPKGGSGGVGLDLPTDLPAPEPGEPAPEPKAVPPAGASPAGEVAISAGAGRILAELKRDRAIDDRLVLAAADALLARGADGLAAARAALSSADAPTMITAVRVLLRGGEPRDADSVVMRLGTRMPARAAAAAVNELIARDPVRATPRLMAELLSHPQQPVRIAAERFLLKNPTPEVPALLEPVLAGKNGDARYRALGVLERIEDPRALELVLARLDDKHAKVAWRAVEIVARSNAPGLDDELLLRAFGERWVLRPAAYALLALIEREDLALVEHLHAQHVPALLRGLESSDSFVSGTCAAALAGVGFRSANADATPWLEQRVPERLVGVVAGFEFFDDYTSLRAPALRRLKQIAGLSFGSDGPRWAEWWLATADDFRPSRAVMAVAEGDERRLQIAYRSGELASGGAFVLLAPDAAGETERAGRSGEVIYLTETQARTLIELLREEGVFGLERLPGVRGGQLDRSRALEVRIGTRAKGFVFGPGASEPWFERVVSLARALRERNRWQAYPHPEHHGSRLGLFAVEGAWWDADPAPRERAMRLKGLVLDHLAALVPEERAPALAELRRLYEEEDAAEAADFERLLALLGEERLFVGRAQTLTRLAHQATGLGAEAGSPDPDVLARAEELVAVLHDRFAGTAAPALAAVLEAQGPEAVRRAASDLRPLVRAVAASVLAASDAAADEQVLLGLLEDANEDVEIAAVAAAGRNGVEAARVELLLRARYGTPLVRVAALRAIGELGGADARETLLANLSDPDSRFRVPAAHGLAALADPETASVLVSILRNGENGELYEPTREGLLRLGREAFEELFAAMRSPSPVLRREAGLILARQSVPESANALIRVLAENPTDARVASELVVLTCVDHRKEMDPAEAWYRWWDGVVRDDALAWFRATCESRGLASPPPSAFEGAGADEAIAFLLEVMRRPEPWLVERARRELSRMIGRDIGDVPAETSEREVWLTTLSEVLSESR